MFTIACGKMRTIASQSLIKIGEAELSLAIACFKNRVF
jgi:hypothetical protein